MESESDQSRERVVLQLSAAASPAYLRFRESHHAVARWFAQGLTISMVAEKTGYTRRRLHLLLSDPTFQELIASYNKDMDAEVRKDLDVYDDLQRRNMIQAELQIMERLDEAHEAEVPIPLHILDRISQGRADRTGYSKHSTIKHEHSFAERLDQAIERSNRARVVNHVPAQIEAQPLGKTTDLPDRVNPKPAVGSRPSFTNVLKRKIR